MKRVNNAERYLKNIINDGTQYYVGFGLQNLTTIAKNSAEIRSMSDGKRNKTVVTGKSGPLKENTAGKLVRKQPENKTSIWKHIEYYSERFEKVVEYDREYNIWEKEILHQFNLELSIARTPQGEIIFHFPKFKMENSSNHYLRAGAAMNMSIILGKMFMIYDTKFEPIIPVTQLKDKSILPAGQYGSVKEKLDTVEKNLMAAGSGGDGSGNSYRFAILKELEPNDVIMGKGGFDEYLIFEFKSSNILVFENLKTGNATYVFDANKFDHNKALDKQTARKDPAFISRIVHENMEHWARDLNTFFKKRK